MNIAPHRPLPVALAICAAAFLYALPVTLADPRIDPSSGRQVATHPPPRHFEHHHMRLEIDIADMSAPTFRARQTLTLAPVGQARSVLVLDAAPPPALRVRRVLHEGMPLGFEQIDHGATTAPSCRTHGTLGSLVITFPEPIPAGQRIEVITEFEVHYPPLDQTHDLYGTGLIWSPGDPQGKSETDRAAQIHSQGQAQHNHRWFPCHDFPNERLTTELIITVEDPYMATSNGRLVGTRLGTPSRDGRPRTMWHWLQDKPHVNYLVSLVVGRFSIVALPPEQPKHRTTNMDGRAVSSYLLAPVGSEESARAVFARTPEMLAFFEERFGHPYPWDKYSQALVRNFAWGGMENTSATTLRDEYAWYAPGSEDDLIAHEIAHQWFGNLVTTASWEHLWLNEAWASYAEALWAEHAAGPDPSQQREAYQRKIAEFLTVQRVTNRASSPGYPAMVSNRYTQPDEIFSKADDVYAKGAVVLHMLRQKLGDEAFFAGTQLYLHRFAFQQVETDDFRRTMEEVSGLSLERFFEQWCHRPGLPRLDVEFDWTPAQDDAGELAVTIHQRQTIDHNNPAYTFALPFHIRTGEDVAIHTVDVDSRTTALTLPLDRRPDHIDIDPDMTIAAYTRITRRLRPEVSAGHDATGSVHVLQPVRSE